MHFQTINSSVDTDETVTAQTLNKSQWRYYEKVLTLVAGVSKIMK